MARSTAPGPRRPRTVTRSATSVSASRMVRCSGHTPRRDSFSAAAAAGGVIFMPETIGILHAYDAATGLELWNSTLPGNTYSGPVISHGLVYMGTSTGLVVYGLPS